MVYADNVGANMRLEKSSVAVSIPSLSHIVPKWCFARTFRKECRERQPAPVVFKTGPVREQWRAVVLLRSSVCTSLAAGFIFLISRYNTVALSSFSNIFNKAYIIPFMWVLYKPQNPENLAVVSGFVNRCIIVQP